MKNILAAVDFSDVTQAVATTAAALAGALDGRLFLLHVAAPEPDFVGYDVGPQTVRDGVAKEIRAEHRQLHELKQPLEQAGLDVTALVVQGATVEKIVQEAARLEADMIVVGSHGHGALHHLLVGSVTEGIMRAAVCPVLVVPRDGSTSAGDI